MLVIGRKMEAKAMILVALVGLGLVSDSLQFWSGSTCKYLS